MDVPLTNFTARILSEVVVDDGVEKRLLFEIDAQQGARVSKFRIPSDRYAGMAWVTEHLGARAIVYPGFGIKDHARAAIQTVSGEVQRLEVFGHTGWRKLDADWCFIDVEGGVGAAGRVVGIEVDLPTDLASFSLQTSTRRDEEIVSIRASLGLLDVAPDRVTAPLLAACARAPIGNPIFSVHIHGRTGVGKTALVSLVQQHFGAGMEAENLPASWLSTANALEGIAFYAKDVVLVVDDFAPDGPSIDVQRMHKQADRLLRAAGNRAGRGRMGPDGSLRRTKFPRALIISTGEDVPRGQSLRARTFLLDLAKGDVAWDRLTVAQHNARVGLYVKALTGFVQWLAPRMETLPNEFRETVAEVRRTVDDRSHRRTATIEAELVCASKLYLEYAQEIGAMTHEERRILAGRFERGIAEAAAAQADHQRSADPVEQFVEQLRSAMSSGAAHVAQLEGGMPMPPARWGWRKRPGEPEQEPHGPRVGWIDEDEDVLYLDMTAAFNVVQKQGAAAGETIGIGKDTLTRRMKEKGLLMIPEKGRHLTWRPSIEGGRPRVLKIPVSKLFPLESGSEDGEEVAANNSRVPQASHTGPTEDVEVGRDSMQ